MDVRRSDTEARSEAPRSYTVSPDNGLFEALVQLEPPPRIAALSEAGLFVPIPGSFPLGNATPITDASSFFEVVRPDDGNAIIEAWERAHEHGAGQATVHLLTDVNYPVTLHFIDVRERFGVLLGLLLDTRAQPGKGLSCSPIFRPRVTTMRKDRLAVMHGVDEAATQILGWRADELLGRRTLEFVHPDDRAHAIANWMDTLQSPGAARRIRLRFRHRDGTYVWFELTNRNELADSVSACVLTEMVDISDEMAALEALHARERLLLLLTEALPLGILQIDTDRRIVHRNERLRAVTGVSAAGTLDEQLATVDAADLPRLHEALDAMLESATDRDLEITLGTPAGPRRSSVSMRALTGEAGDVTGAIICFSDITERARLHEELEIRATYDALTGCHNRSSILSLLESSLHDARKDEARIAIMFIDLDGFKAINDRFGHDAGDAVLRQTGKRLIAEMRGADAVGRLGGDEFLIVCRNVTTIARALDVGGRIASAIAREMTLTNAVVKVGASIGIAWTDSPTDASTFVARADAAMYESKRLGAGRPVLASATYASSA